MKPPILLIIVVCLCLVSFLGAQEKAGCRGKVGCLENPKEVVRLEITKPGVYENFLVDSQWQGGNRVKITADNVTLRHCEIRNSTGNGVGVFGDNVIIENCRIHHMLAGGIKDQKDAHGITGHWGHVTIRNCDIAYTSGDSVQFDPERGSVGELLIENCTFSTAPLPADAAGFHKGEIPGENAVDTKVKAGESNRCKLSILNSYFHGWQQPGAIETMAALNLKEHIAAEVTNCVFRHNQIAFRLRGPGPRGGALVHIKNCTIHDGEIGLRIEDKIENLKITNLAFGSGVTRKYHEAAGGFGPGYLNEGERPALPIADLIEKPTP